MSQAAAVGAAMELEFDFATDRMESSGWKIWMGGEGISGRYRKNGAFFHEKEVYQLQGPAIDQGYTIFLYFFSHGGADNEGWWIGPEVGGQAVWAHNKKLT